MGFCFEFYNLYQCLFVFLDMLLWMGGEIKAHRWKQTDNWQNRKIISQILLLFSIVLTFLNTTNQQMFLKLQSVPRNLFYPSCQSWAYFKFLLKNHKFDIISFQSDKIFKHLSYEKYNRFQPFNLAIFQVCASNLLYLFVNLFTRKTKYKCPTDKNLR